jgi:hypothetical protein
MLGVEEVATVVKARVGIDGRMRELNASCLEYALFCLSCLSS